jgi:hypothetical protein
VTRPARSRPTERNTYNNHYLYFLYNVPILFLFVKTNIIKNQKNGGRIDQTDDGYKRGDDIATDQRLDTCASSFWATGIWAFPETTVKQ